MKPFVEYQVPGHGPSGRPKKTWRKSMEEDLATQGVNEAALDKNSWRSVIKHLTLQWK